MARAAKEDISQVVAAFLRQHRIQGPILVACSGGADSTALALALHHLGRLAGLTHVNYHLRGTDSDGDEQFVRALADQCNVPCYVLAVDGNRLAAQAPQGLQAKARHIRYEWFQHIAMQHNLHWVATAHHQDDVAETVLLSLLRSADAVLKGIKPLWQITPQVQIIRPLLEVPGLVLRQWLKAQKIKWREDASNATDAYQRNQIRHDVLPALTAIHPQASQQLAAALTTYQQQRRALLSLLPPTDAFWQPVQDRLELRLSQLDGLPEAARPIWIARSVRQLLGVSPRQAQAYSQLVTDRRQQKLAIGLWRVWRKADRIWVRARRLPPLAIAGDGEGTFGRTKLTWRIVPAASIELPPPPGIAYLPWTGQPLTIRSWQPGDRIQPLGMTGRRHVADVLNDLGVPGWRKRHHFVITNGNGEVVYVQGYRIAETARVRDGMEWVVAVQL